MQSLRSLVRHPAFLLTSVIVLGISLGNQIALSSLIDTLLIAPPTAQRPSELVFARSATADYVSHPDFLAVQERSTSLSGTFGSTTYRSAGVVAGATFLNTSCTAVSGSYFPALGVSAAAGRLLGEADDHPSAAPAAVLTAEFRAKLQAKIGDLIRVNNVPFTVVGVLPADFRPIERGRSVGLWLPLTHITPFRLPQFLTNKNFQWIRVGGRLKPGVSVETAEAELKAIGGQIQAENPTGNHGMELGLRSFTSSRLAEGGVARVVLLLYGIALLLSALAFVNFAALTFLRLLTRRRELAIRLSLGATRSDISLPLLVELLVVCSLATLVGLGGAELLNTAFRLDPALAPLIDANNGGVSLRAVLPILTAAILCGTIIWALAMRFAYQPGISAAAREGQASPHRQRASLTLYATQFGIVFCLVAMAIAMVSQLRALERRELPIRTEKLLLTEVNTTLLGLAANRQAKEKFLLSVVQALRDVPGVLAVGGFTAPPLFSPGSTNILVHNDDPALSPDKNFAHYGPTTAGYFAAIGARLVEGRELADGDFVANAAKVVVINRATVRRFFPSGNALGQHLKPWSTATPHTIVGVVDDIPVSNDAKIPPQIFLPHTLVSSTSSLTYAIHVAEDSARMRNALRDALKQIWPDVSVPHVYPIQDQIDRSRIDVKLAVRVTLVIACVATVVIGFGLYFFSAYAAAQTLRQSAIRLAVGASPSRVMLEHLLAYRWALIAGAALGFGLWLAARKAGDALAVQSGPLGLFEAAVALACVTAIAVIGLCVPLRVLYRLSVYRVLSRSD